MDVHGLWHWVYPINSQSGFNRMWPSMARAPQCSIGSRCRDKRIAEENLGRQTYNTRSSVFFGMNVRENISVYIYADHWLKLILQFLWLPTKRKRPLFSLTCYWLEFLSLEGSAILRWSRQYVQFCTDLFSLCLDFTLRLVST